MSKKRLLQAKELMARAKEVARLVINEAHDWRQKQESETWTGKMPIYAVPRGGVSAYYLVESFLQQWTASWPLGLLGFESVDSPEEAAVIIDDLVDSGRTAERMLKLNGAAKFFALIHKGVTPGYAASEWLVFPWEGTEEKSIEDTFVRLLQYIGEDPTRGGLIETPARMAKAWKHWTSGYGKDASAILKTFEDGGETYDEMVHVREIPFYSQCEHHLAPFFGTVTFAYIPDKRVVGLSKMNRLVDVFARRLQVQERLTADVIDAFCKAISPKGAGIMVRARHLCVESRGVAHRGCETTTSSFRGVLKEGPNSIAARAEFFSLCRV